MPKSVKLFTTWLDWNAIVPEMYSTDYRLFKAPFSQPDLTLRLGEPLKPLHISIRDVIKDLSEVYTHL